MSSHTWRMQWASCWRTEKILVSMALPGSSLNSKYIRMLPIGPAWAGAFGNRVHGEWGWTRAGYIVNAGFYWVSQGLPECVLEMYMGFVQFSTSSMTNIHVKQSLWGTAILKTWKTKFCLSWSGLLVSNCLRNTEANCFTDCFWFQQHSFFLFLSMNLSCLSPCVIAFLLNSLIGCLFFS